MKQITLLLFLVCSLSACVPQSDFDKVSAENRDLKKQLDELENGAERLYKQALEFTKTDELDKAEEKLKILFEKHNESQEASKAQNLALQIKSKRLENAEKAQWEAALKANTIPSFETYNSKYPKGKFVRTSKINIASLIRANEQNEYETALKTNSSSVLHDFIAKYPNNRSVGSFKKKIIELEIDEIFGASNTGHLPTFERNGYGSSATSSLEIENGTGCQLTVRYSGNDVRMIQIPAGATRSVSLSSGNYRIAASACGANYAGTESLQGSYSSRYYISTSRY